MAKNKDSYKQIFKSTSIVGGAQILNILIGVIKTKIFALLLGPSGVGIAGIFQTIVDLVRDATGFGINFSGVKNIAEVSATNDTEKIAKTILILRRWAFGTGLLGMFLIIILSTYFSRYSFGNDTYSLSIVLLSVILLITSISSGQLALLQGLRKIDKMAKGTLIGSILGVIITLPLYWFIGISAVVPGMILTALGTLIVSWFYAKQIKISKVHLSFKETFYSGIGMAKLGFFIVVNGFIATIALYIIRKLIMNHLGLNFVGLFQAVWTISTIYINILLHAMLADYYPRLSVIHSDNNAANKLINEQLEITLLIGTPMLAGMIVFAPLVINILYSSSFTAAIPMLRWQLAASFLTLVSWPLGVLYLSKNEGWQCMASETLRQVVFVGVVFICWDAIGFNILGIGFFIAAAANLIYVILSLKKISGFMFTNVNMKYILINGITILIILQNSLFNENVLMYIINIIALVILCLVSFYRLNKLVDIKSFFKRKYIQ